MASLSGYEKAGRVLRLVGYLACVAAVGIAAAFAIPSLAQGETLRGVVGGLVCLALFGGLGVFEVAVGRGLARREPWTRPAGIVLGVLHLPGFPLGTIIGAYVIYHLVQGWEPEPASQRWWSA